MIINIHTKGIKGSATIEDGEFSDVMFGSILEINGHVLDRVTSVTVETQDDFTVVKATFIPGDVQIYTHTEESWKELADRADADIAAIRQADGRLLARHKR